MMPWFRKSRSCGGWLALFALALQLALSFGHTHAEDFAGIAGHSPLSVSNTAPQHDDGDAHDICAVCLTAQLLGSGAQAQPPVLALPDPPAFTFTARAVAAVAAHPSPSFQARGPPAA